MSCANHHMGPHGEHHCLGAVVTLGGPRVSGAVAAKPWRWWLGGPLKRQVDRRNCTANQPCGSLQLSTLSHPASLVRASNRSSVNL